MRFMELAVLYTFDLVAVRERAKQLSTAHLVICYRIYELLADSSKMHRPSFSLGDNAWPKGGSKLDKRIAVMRVSIIIFNVCFSLDRFCEKR